MDFSVSALIGATVAFIIHWKLSWPAVLVFNRLRGHIGFAQHDFRYRALNVSPVVLSKGKTRWIGY